MTVNRIEQVRAEARKYFNPNGAIAGSEAVHFSPSGKYKLTTQIFEQNKPDRNWEVTRIEVLIAASGEKLFELTATYNRFFFTWLNWRDHEVLVCAEDPFGGQTVIDLTERRLNSYSPDADGFIWTEHFLSPDEKMLAVQGCVWGSPYYMNVYDFSSPLELPLPLIQAFIDLDDNGDDFGGWVDNETIRIRTYDKQERFVKVKRSEPDSNSFNAAGSSATKQ